MSVFVAPTPFHTRLCLLPSEKTDLEAVMSMTTIYVVYVVAVLVLGLFAFRWKGY
jgi:hypothetical protein